MAEQHIHIGIENENEGFSRFVEAWHQAEEDTIGTPEVHLNFEDLASLLSLLTPKRFELLKQLRDMGETSIRSLAAQLNRDYKNVHSDVKILESAGLIDRNDSAQIRAPWDVIDAHFRLVA